MVSSGLTPRGPCPSLFEGTRAGCNTPAEISPEGSWGGESCLMWHCAGCSPGHVWFSGLGMFIKGHVQPHPPAPSSLSPRGCLGLFIPQCVLLPMVGIGQEKHLALGLLKSHEIPMDLSPKLFQVPLDDIWLLRHDNNTTQLGVFCKLPDCALNSAV